MAEVLRFVALDFCFVSTVCFRLASFFGAEVNIRMLYGCRLYLYTDCQCPWPPSRPIFG